MSSDLVAKLGTDNTAWDAGFRRASGSVTSFSSGLSGLLGPAVGALAGLWGAAESVGAYKGALEAQRKLSAVIEATGGAAGLTTGQIADFAAEMQQLTNFEDDATTGAAAALAAFTNIRGQTFTDTIESAMDLSTVMGGDLESNVKLLGKALSDPEAGLKKLAKAGVTFTDQQEKQIVTMQKSGDLLGAQDALLAGVQAKFGGAAMAVADPWKQLQNTFGDVAENIGSVLLPSINVVIGGIQSFLGPIAGAGESFLDFGIEAAVTMSAIGGLFQTYGELVISIWTPVIETVASMFSWLWETIGLGGSSFQDLIVEATVVLSNIGAIVSIASDQWALFFVQIGLGAAHFFTEVIPAYLNWFGENWINIIVTGASNTLTVFENLGTNIRSAWSAVLAFFRTGKFEMDWTPLSQGFINTVGELPDIAPRVVTDLEKGLESSIESATSQLGESMSKQREELTGQLNAKRETITAEFNTESKVPSGAIVDAVDAGGKKDKTDNKVALAGSQDAARVALSGLSGNKTMEELQKEQLEVQKKQLEELKEARKNRKSGGSSDGEDIPA